MTMWIVTVVLFTMAFTIVALILSAYTRRITEVSLTEKFRASETITEGSVPGAWIAAINRRIAGKAVMRFLTGEVSGQQLALMSFRVSRAKSTQMLTLVIHDRISRMDEDDASN